jgi:glycosyltransferase involved in cell wall biosynthesis
MISIVIPLYNKVESIKDTVDSVLMQSYQNFELIVVNDGSTDGSERVVQGISDWRVRLVNQENAGVSVARNRGARYANHSHICFLDADDRWHPDFLDAVLRLAQEYPDLPWWATKHKAILADDEIVDETLLSRRDLGVDLIDYAEVARLGIGIHVCATLFNRAVFLEVGGFPPGVIFAEDADLMFRFSILGLLPLDRRELSYYRRHGENRACNNRRVGPLPPMFFDFDSILMPRQKMKQDIRVYNQREFLVSRILDEVAFLKKMKQPLRQYYSLVWKCRKTDKSRARYFKSLIIGLLPNLCFRVVNRLVKGRSLTLR